MKFRAPLAFTALLFASSAAHADDITISPRAWLIVDALSGGDLSGTGASAGETSSFNSKPFVVPMLGASIEVPTPDGSVRVKVPPHSQSGRQLRVKGKGVPPLRGGTSTQTQD